MADIRRRWLIAGLAAVAALSPLAAATAFAVGDAVDDAYTIDEDAMLTADGVANPGVLANDTTDLGTLCVVSFDTSSLQGTFAAASDGSGLFEYHPPANFNGTTGFSYTVASDIGAGCPSVAEDTATVTITVNAVNDQPSASNDSYSALADRTLNAPAPGVLGNDSDVDGDPLTAVLVDSPSHGALTLAANGGFSYTPANGFTGADLFSYRASDGDKHSPIRVVSLNVTAIPTPTPTPVPTVPPATASPEPSPSESPMPSDSAPPSASPLPSDSGLASASPSAGPVTGPVAEGGGPPLLAIVALLLLVGLLAVAGVYFVRSQRADDEGGDDPAGADYDDGGDDDPDDIDPADSGGGGDRDG